MKYRLITSGVVTAAMAGVLCYVSIPAAQNRAPVPKASTDPAKTPKTADGHPDFSGFYNLVDIYRGDAVEEKPGQHVVTRAPDGSVFFDYGGANAGGDGEGGGPARPRAANPERVSESVSDRTCVSCENPPYKPEYMAKVKAIVDNMHGNASPLDPQYDCKPYGVPRGSLRGGGGYAMQVVQNKDVMAFLYEDRPGPYFRIIYLDGRQHPEDLDKSFYGHSVGRWEGDTLVVDVTGLSDDTWLGSGTVGPKYALMHSDQMHVIERWTRRGDIVTYEATVEDPVMFTKPWVMTPRRTQLAAPDDYIRPTMCIPLDKEHLVKNDGTTYAAPKGTQKKSVAPKPGVTKTNPATKSTPSASLSKQ